MVYDVRFGKADVEATFKLGDSSATVNGIRDGQTIGSDD